MQKLLILGLGQGKYKMSLERRVYQNKEENTQKAEGWDVSKGPGSQPERAPSGQNWNKLMYYWIMTQ